MSDFLILLFILSVIGLTITFIFFLLKVIVRLFKKALSQENKKSEAATKNIVKPAETSCEEADEEDPVNLEFIECCFEDIKKDPDKKDNWLGLTAKEAETLYYKAKRSKILFSESSYKHISNIIASDYEDDLLYELDYETSDTIGDWIDSKKRNGYFLTSKTWRKIIRIQKRVNY